MTLAQFASLIGADPKWVQNTSAILRRPLSYTATEARHLGLVRRLQATLGVPLAEADKMASIALAATAQGLTTVRTDRSGSIAVTVDVARYLSSFTAALSHALVLHVPRRRGRPRRPSRPRGIEAARDYGVDIELLKASLRRSPVERLRRLDADAAFASALRRGGGRRRAARGDGR